VEWGGDEERGTVCLAATLENSTNVLHTLLPSLQQLRDLRVEYAAMTHLQVRAAAVPCSKGHGVVWACACKPTHTTRHQSRQQRSLTGQEARQCHVYGTAAVVVHVAPRLSPRSLLCAAVGG
jgi:hypothetical protein